MKLREEPTSPMVQPEKAEKGDAAVNQVLSALRAFTKTLAGKIFSHPPNGIVDKKDELVISEETTAPVAETIQPTFPGNTYASPHEWTDIEKAEILNDAQRGHSQHIARGHSGSWSPVK